MKPFCEITHRNTAFVKYQYFPCMLDEICFNTTREKKTRFKTSRRERDFDFQKGRYSKLNKNCRLNISCEDIVFIRKEFCQNILIIERWKHENDLKLHT